MTTMTIVPDILRAGLTGILLSMLIFVSSVCAEDPVQAEITHLLDFVRNSKCVFIRNGQAYESRDAEIHIKRKYRHFKDDITSAEDFIDLTATRSTFSGQGYTVRCGGLELPSSSWLLTELDAFRRRLSKEKTGSGD
jgi:hypothetical protein